MSTRLEQRVVPKAASYIIRAAADRPGTIFTTRGAGGAVVFTLPTPARPLLGWWFEFLNVVDQDITVAAAAADQIVTLHDLVADSVAASTGNQKIGARMRATCIETAAGTFQWAVSGIAVGHTYTVA